jgi:hypothetical protein
MKRNTKMSCHLQLLLLSCLCIAAGCSTNTETEIKAANKSNNAESRMIDSAIAAVTVVDFFNAFDERDTIKMKDLLLPATIIVHHNGAVTNTGEMMQVISETKNWWPRVRTLSNFEYVHDSGLAIMSLLNKVSFSLPGNKTVEEPYRETWIFKKTEHVWKPIRIHYSKIVVEKHSEEVNPEN